MMTGDIIKLNLSVDINNQWFVSVWVEMHGRKAVVRFKVDTGCNSVVLSHSTLKSLGISTSNANLSKLSDETAKLASGEKSSFKSLGAVSLSLDKVQSVPICNAKAICHATRKTNDLLGTEVFKQFASVAFNLAGDKYMELKKS